MKRVLQTIDRLKKPAAHRDDDTKLAQRERRAQLKIAERAHPALRDELDTQNRNYAHVMKRIDSAKGNFFSAKNAEQIEHNSAACEFRLFFHTLVLISFSLTSPSSGALPFSLSLSLS